MALANACELPGTFQLPVEQIYISMAGGVPEDGRMQADTEDSLDEAIAAERALHSGDAAIVVSASGNTPYALAFAEAASAQGANVIGVDDLRHPRPDRSDDTGGQDRGVA